MWPAIEAGASTKEEVHRSVSNAENTASEVRDVIIVGSGPAGYTAAVYTARANLKPLLLAGSVTAGGELMNTTDVENYPGFPDGIMGPDLMENFEKQAARFGTEIQFEDVTDLDLDGDVKTVTIGTGETFKARSIILSTGSAYRELGLPNEKRLSGHGVSWCATCDGFFFKDQDIAVIGGGDSAMEEALFLTKFAKSVTVVHRRDALRASKIMADRALAHEKINFVWNTGVEDVLGQDKVTALRLKNLVDGTESELAVTGAVLGRHHVMVDEDDLAFDRAFGREAQRIDAVEIGDLAGDAFGRSRAAVAEGGDDQLLREGRDDLRALGAASPYRHFERFDVDVGKSHGRQALDRPLAGAFLGLRRRQPLADLGSQALDDVPRIMVILERIVAQRGDLRIGDDGRWERRHGLLGEGRCGGDEEKRQEELGLHRVCLAGEGRKSRSPVD